MSPTQWLLVTTSMAASGKGMVPATITKRLDPRLRLINSALAGEQSAVHRRLADYPAV